MAFGFNIVCLSLVLLSSGAGNINLTQTGDTLYDDIYHVEQVLAVGIVALYYCQKLEMIDNHAEDT